MIRRARTLSARTRNFLAAVQLVASVVWLNRGQILGQSYKFNDVEPLAYLTDVLQRVAFGRTRSHELHMVLLGNWHPENEVVASLAAGPLAEPRIQEGMPRGDADVAVPRPFDPRSRWRPKL